MRKASLVGFMTVALLQGCAAPWLPQPAPEAEPEAAPLPPFNGERRVVVEPLRGITKVDLIGGPAAGEKQDENDLWARIRKGFGMPDLDNALVRRKTREYAASSEYLQRMFERSRIYLYHIVDEVEKRGLPTELVLLPMVESAFNPMARSPSTRRASGSSFQAPASAST